jgi:hypothetical protein
MGESSRSSRSILPISGKCCLRNWKIAAHNGTSAERPQRGSSLSISSTSAEAPSLRISDRLRTVESRRIDKARSMARNPGGLIAMGAFLYVSTASTVPKSLAGAGLRLLAYL